MNIKSSGNFVASKVIATTYMNEELQNQLNGMSLGQAQEEGIIEAEKFVDVTKKYSGFKGTEEFTHTEIVTDKGNAILSKDLGNNLEDWEDDLGSLVFKVGHTEPTEERPESVRFFRLQRPGGSVVEERTDLSVGQ